MPPASQCGTIKARPALGRCQGEKLACAIERFERRVGIVAIDRVQRIIGVYFVDRSKGVVRVDAIDRICRIARIEAVNWIEWILGINGVDGIERIVRPVLIDRIEDVVVALVLLREAWLGACWCDGEEEQPRKDEDNPHGEPPKNEIANVLSLLPAWEQRKRTAKAPSTFPLVLSPHSQSAFLKPRVRAFSVTARLV